MEYPDVVPYRLHMVPHGLVPVLTVWYHMALHACGSLTVFIYYKFFHEKIEVHFNPCPGDSINQLMISKVASMCACAPVEEKKMIMIADSRAGMSAKTKARINQKRLGRLARATVCSTV